MLQVAYTVSSNLRLALTHIETVRRDILLAPLSQKTEIALRFETMVNRLYLSQGEEVRISKNDIAGILSRPGYSRFTRDERRLLDYKLSFDYVKDNWLANPAEVTSPDVSGIASRLTGSGNLAKSAHKNLANKTDNLLGYLQSRREHPVILSAIAYSQIINDELAGEYSQSLATLLAYLFLYKHGMDFRGLVCLEHFCNTQEEAYVHALNSIAKEGNCNLWLFFFIQGLTSRLKAAYDSFAGFLSYYPGHLLALNSRQKAILTFLETPGSIVTNKEVQRLFGISQVTASRDLTKLATLGLLVTGGKGRSVYYTKG